jgi:hypothetical protein
VDYEDKFGLFTRHASIRVVISIASIMRWRIHHMDVKTIFLNEINDKEVYLEKN